MRKYDGIIIFGGMGCGKDTVSSIIEESLNGPNFVCTFNIGDLCREFMKIGIVNEKWKNDSRTLGQLVASKMREIDEDIFNQYTKACIIESLNDVGEIKVHKDGSEMCIKEVFIPIVTGGRTIADFKYWNEQNYLSIGVEVDKDLSDIRLRARDEDQIQGDSNRQHSTERDVSYIINNLCEEKIVNNGTIQDLKDKVKEIVERYEW